MTIRTLGVIGAGTMGDGIAQAAAQAGLDVVMQDIMPEAVERGLAAIGTSLDRLIRKEKLDEAGKAAALARIRGTTDVAALKGADLVIEAATERESVKAQVLRNVEAVVRPEAILATNTSSISITRLAASLKDPSRFVGMHFFNPVPMMALVEIISGLQTSQATFDAVTGLAKTLGKTPISVRNAPGFVVNRLLCPMINEAVFTLQDGVASAVEIDEVLAARVRTWFDLPRSPRLRIRVGDAAEVVEGLRPGQWDVIVRDVFNGGSVPASCRSGAFMASCLEALAPGGLLLVNTSSVPRSQAGAEIQALREALEGKASGLVIVADPAAMRGRRRGNLVLVARPDPFTAGELEEVERAVRRLPLPVRTWSPDDAAVPRPEGVLPR